MADFYSELARRIGVRSDRTRFEGDAVYFYFDSPESWAGIFQGMAELRAAVIRAYMLGFRRYIFVRDDGVEIPSSHKYWIPRDRGHLRGRSS